MSFAEPYLLWGMLAVAIPVIIHFWHQKQGKPLPWAAMQWLTEEQQQQSRGLRLDNILLLILRCLLLMLLAFLLAQPLLNWFRQTPTIQTVHLVQPNKLLTDNFRFELDEARKKGERVVWATANLEPLNSPPATNQQLVLFSPLQLQTAINQLDTKNTDLHLYLINDQTLADVPAITVPERFRLHTVVDSTPQPRAYLSIKSGKKLFVNRAEKLTARPTLDPTLRFRPAPAHSGPVRTLLSYRNARERQTVKAALLALTDVYGFDLTLSEQPTPNSQYDWVLTDQPPAKPSPQTLYTVSAIDPSAPVTNIIYTNESLTPQTSERVETGQLPEWLGKQFLHHYSLQTTPLPLSQRDLAALFIRTTKPASEQQAGVQNALLLLFVVLLVLERRIALTKNA